MGYKVIWSEFAENQIDKMYQYHHHKAGSRIALKLIKGIINTPNKLRHEPKIGQVEELLKNRTYEYRYMVYKSYKIIYSIDE